MYKCVRCSKSYDKWVSMANHKRSHEGWSSWQQIPEGMKEQIRKSRLREGNPNWKDGCHTYRKIAKEKYPQICAFCDSKEDLHVHHKNHNKKDNTIGNLIILCRSCHTKEHFDKNKLKILLKGSQTEEAKRKRTVSFREYWNRINGRKRDNCGRFISMEGTR